MDSHRTERVSEALREELGEMIAYELSDPRIGELPSPKFWFPQNEARAGTIAF